MWVIRPYRLEAINHSSRVMNYPAASGRKLALVRLWRIKKDPSATPRAFRIGNIIK